MKPRTGKYSDVYTKYKAKILHKIFMANIVEHNYYLLQWSPKEFNTSPITTMEILSIKINLLLLLFLPILHRHRDQKKNKNSTVPHHAWIVFFP